MKVTYTDDALADLRDISDWLSIHYPTIAPHVARRIQDVVAHLARWPDSARRVADRPNARAFPLGRYPYIIFYTITGDTVEILHVHHGARQR